MNTEQLANTRLGGSLVRLLAAAMESRFRYRFFPPLKILSSVEILSGQYVLEIGCGTGYFTIPAAELIGEKGNLTAIDILQESVDFVESRIQAAGLKNVSVSKKSALDTGFDDQIFDTVLLFGVIPAPMLPLNQLLIEIHRILKASGTLAVWPPIPGFLPGSVLKSGLFNLRNKNTGVYNFQSK